MQEIMQKKKQFKLKCTVQKQILYKAADSFEKHFSLIHLVLQLKPVFAKMSNKKFSEVEFKAFKGQRSFLSLPICRQYVACLSEL